MTPQHKPTAPSNGRSEGGRQSVNLGQVLRRRRRPETPVHIGARRTELLPEHVITLDRVATQLHVVAGDHPADVGDVRAQPRLAVAHVDVDSRGAAEYDLIEEARGDRGESASRIRGGTRG